MTTHAQRDTESPQTNDKELILATLRENFPHLAAEYGVTRIGLFGSFAKGVGGAESDVDLVVEFEKPLGFRFMQLTEYLEALLGREVDVLTPAGIAGIRVERVARDIAENTVYV